MPLPATKSQEKRWSKEIRTRLSDWVATEIVPRIKQALDLNGLPATVRAERTFWEKATAIHVFCAQGAFRGGDHFARHWHDLTRLDAAGFAEAAIADKSLARAVADHKSVFFAEKNMHGVVIDYHAAVKPKPTRA